MNRPPALIESPFHRFFLFDTPDNDSLPVYIQELKSNDVKTVVRVCDPTYDGNIMRESGIELHEMCFPDGGVPPPSLVDEWLGLLKATKVGDGKKNTIGIHCVAGLGRTPLLVAIALIETGMPSLEAVAFIRKHRKGAINKIQLEYLRKYKPKAKKKGCIIM